MARPLCVTAWLFLAASVYAKQEQSPEDACRATGGDAESPGECAKGKAKPPVDHLLLQLRNRVGAKDPSHALETCTAMPHVEKTCSDDGCTVLATDMTGKNCDQYCAEAGRTCELAWDEVDETCEKLVSIRCDQVRETSDLICQCSSGLSSADKCLDMDRVKTTCSDDQCKVLASGMTGKMCREYCGRAGLTCVTGWEEQDNNCAVKEDLGCDKEYPGTSDLLCECAPSGNPIAPTLPNASGLHLVWSDEFNGDCVDSSKWHFIEAGGGFGNQELQHYTKGNAHVEDGKLHITGRCEDYHGSAFTSAKLTTEHSMDWGPGHRIEVRAKVPVGRGTWPAIWMLPTSNVYGGWPKSGEIDIMEAVGCSQGKIYGTIHTEAFNHMIHTERFSGLKTRGDEWHTYTIEWRANSLRWYLDGIHYHTFSPGSEESAKWPFSQKFFLILNLAVGGSWGGMCLDGHPSCDRVDEFGTPQVMEVDYARVYRLDEVATA